MADTLVVYVIAEFDNDEPTGYCKVGKSTEKQLAEEGNRLSNLQTGNPRRLKVLLYVPVRRPFEVEKYMSEIAKIHKITLPATTNRPFSTDGEYPERTTEWYKIDGRSVGKFFKDFTAAVQAHQ